MELHIFAFDEREHVFLLRLSHVKSITRLRLLLDTASQCTVTPGMYFLQMHILVEISLNLVKRASLRQRSRQVDLWELHAWVAQCHTFCGT
jgi:hypothetical protein